MDSTEENVEDVMRSSSITIARNRAGRQAFMNNAPVDNFGSKVYQYVLLLSQLHVYFLCRS
jgi:hypothetical protein